MNAEQIAALRRDNSIKREALVAEMEARRERALLDPSPSEWSPRDFQAPEPAPASPTPASPFATKADVVALLERFADTVGECSGIHERDLRAEIRRDADAVETRLADLERRVADLELEADARRSWFGWSKRK